MRLTTKTAVKKEQDIRDTRPAPQKGSTIVEDAHELDQYVAEAEGFGGRAGNVHEVRELVLDVVNRQPSGFPYQGNTTAGIILDFVKTAEVLESHGLDDEAAQLDAIAARMVQYAEAIGLKKRAGDDPFEGLDVLTHTEELEDMLGVPGTTPPPSAEAPKAGPAKPKGVAPDPAPPKPKATPAAPEAAPVATPAPSAEAGGDTKKAPAAPHGAESHGAATPHVDAPDHDKAGKPAAKTKGGAGVFGKLLTLVGAVGTIGSFMDGNTLAGITNAVMTGGSAFLNAEHIGKLKDLMMKNPRAAGAATVAAVAGLVAANTIANSLKETFDVDAQDAIAELNSYADDSSYPQSFRAHALSAAEKLSKARTIYTGVVNEGGLGDDQARELLSLIEGAKSDADRAKMVGEESSVFRAYVGFPKLDALMKDVSAHADKVLRNALGKSKTTVEEIKSSVQSAGGEAGPASSAGGRPTAADDEARIAGLQREFGLPTTGKPDQALMLELSKLSDMWVAYEPSLAKVMTASYLLENATDKTIVQLDQLWRRRELISQ